MSNVARASTRVGPGGKFRKIMFVKVESAYKLLLTYDSGETRRFDFQSTILASGITEFTAPFTDEEFFKKVGIERGNLVWPNGFDLHGEDVFRASIAV